MTSFELIGTTNYSDCVCMCVNLVNLKANFSKSRLGISSFKICCKTLATTKYFWDLVYKSIWDQNLIAERVGDDTTAETIIWWQ